MTTVDLPLLPLGRGKDLGAERGVECPGDLPAPSDPDLVERARAAKAALGDRVFVLGHHYQRDEVIAFADVTGDSFKLARDAAARPDAEFVVFRSRRTRVDHELTHTSGDSHWLVGRGW